MAKIFPESGALAAGGGAVLKPGAIPPDFRPLFEKKLHSTGYFDVLCPLGLTGNTGKENRKKKDNDGPTARCDET